MGEAKKLEDELRRVVLAVPRAEFEAMAEGEALRLQHEDRCGYFSVPRATGLRIHDREKSK